MLNSFPALLNFTFFAPTFLRAAAGLIFAHVAYRQWKEREELGRISYLLVGKGRWIVWLAIFWEALVALGLVLGFYTQIAALLGALSAMKYFIWQRRYPAMVVLQRPASFLLLVICLSLLLTGAGALAFDVPL